MAVYQIPETQFAELKEKLQACIPRSLQVLGILKNVMIGKCSANFYVDKWPEFLAVVVETKWPCLSDVADISCYATSSEAVLHILTEGNLFTWGKRQAFKNIEVQHAELVMRYLKSHEAKPVVEWHNFEGIGCFAPSVTSVEESSVPEGFTSGKLQLHHAQLVSDNWDFANNWPKKVSYLRELIGNFENRAVFADDNPDTPIAWCIEKPNGELGIAFVAEKYRNKGLFKVVRSGISSATLRNGFHPVYIVKNKDAPSALNNPFEQPFGDTLKAFFICKL